MNVCEPSDVTPVSGVTPIYLTTSCVIIWVWSTLISRCGFRYFLPHARIQPHYKKFSRSAPDVYIAYIVCTSNLDLVSFLFVPALYSTLKLEIFSFTCLLTFYGQQCDSW